MIPGWKIEACIKAFYGCNDDTTYGKIQHVLMVYESMHTTPQPAQGEYPPECAWPPKPFTVRDEPGEHDPCWLVMPDGAMVAFNHHAEHGVDQARVKFIADACTGRPGKEWYQRSILATDGPVKCETCNGAGSYDERLGGYAFSNPKAPCPDCDGHGEIYRDTKPPAQADTTPAAHGVGDDKKRIDWLEANEADLCLTRQLENEGGEYSVWWNVIGELGSISGHPLACPREAIDAAMLQATSAPGGPTHEESK